MKQGIVLAWRTLKVGTSRVATGYANGRKFCVGGSCLLHTSPTHHKSTFLTSSREAVADIHDGASILVGGFGAAGVPESLIAALVEKGVKDLTVYSNDAGMPDYGLGHLIARNQMKRFVGSYVGENPEVSRKYYAGEIELELVPQGSLAERIRAGGAGIPAFYTPSGYGTMIHLGRTLRFDANHNPVLRTEPKEARDFKGKNYLLEEAITADFALIKAYKADRAGNLIFRKAARNFNVPMCKAASTTIAEVEEIVETGEIDGDDVHVPHIYVHRVIQCEVLERRIHKLVLHHDDQTPVTTLSGTALKDEHIRERIARRVALEFRHGMYANLGIGMPMIAADHIPEGMRVTLHSENGLLGLGRFPTEEEVDADLINAGKETVTVIPGASFFASDESFAIVRGSHIHLTVLGGMQVSQFGDLANWVVPGKKMKGMGGAMDLVATTGTKVVVTMTHCTKTGESKIRGECTYPLTGKHCVDMVITEKAVFKVDKEEGLTLIEIADGVSMEELKRTTDCEFHVAEDLKPMGSI